MQAATFALHNFSLEGFQQTFREYLKAAAAARPCFWRPYVRVARLNPLWGLQFNVLIKLRLLVSCRQLMVSPPRLISTYFGLRFANAILRTLNLPSFPSFFLTFVAPSADVLKSVFENFVFVRLPNQSRASVDFSNSCF